MKKIINSNQAPAPIGPYSQAVLAKSVLYCSGQIAMDPKSGALITETLEKENRFKGIKDTYSKLLGTGPYDMIFVKGRGEFLKKLKILSKIVSLY